jgi:hypothetical protein
MRLVEEELVLVYTTNVVLEGELTKARLRDEGIPVLAKGEGEGPYRMGPVHLYVPASHEPQARLVLAAIERGDYAVADEDVDAEG